jgi:hypothetical protein
MPSLSAKDRVSLCQFTFADGRRCRSLRTSKQSPFCFDHAQKEARARAVDHLGKDLDFFFSGGYLSACDLSTALARILPAVLRGDVKPRAARTLAYMAQTLLQAIRMSQHEYINAFDTTDWCNSIRNSVNGNYNYRFPHAAKPAPAPAPDQPISPQPRPHPAETFESCHSEHSEESAFSSSPASAPQPACPERTRRAPAPHTPLPPTSAEFAEHLLAGLKTGQSQTPQPAEEPPQVLILAL